MPSDLQVKKTTRKSKLRSKPYRWDLKGSPVSDPTPWLKKNTRDAQKYDKIAAEVATGEYNELPTRWKCDRCKRGKWPCLFRRGVGATCCLGCSHSKLKCLRDGMEPEMFLRVNELLPPSPPTSHDCDRSSHSHETPPPLELRMSHATPGLDIPTPPDSHRRVRAHGPSQPSQTHDARSPSVDARVEAVDAGLRRPVLPRGSAEPSRELPPLETLSLHERGTYSFRRHSSEDVTPERHHHHRTFNTPSSPTPASAPACDGHVTGAGAVLLMPDTAWRVPFLKPHRPSPREADMVRQLGWRPRYMWRASVGCHRAQSAGFDTVYGDLYIPRHGGFSIPAPRCLHCKLSGRPCQFIVRSGEDIYGYSGVQLTVLREKGLSSGVTFQQSAYQFHTTISELVDELTGDDERSWADAWNFTLPALLRTAERFGKIDVPRVSPDSARQYRNCILGEDGESRYPLLETLRHIEQPDAYDPLLVKDLLRRLPGGPLSEIQSQPPSSRLALDETEPLRTGLLRAGAEFAAWSLDPEGALTLFLRDTERHREADTSEVKKLFDGSSSQCRLGGDTFTLWPSAKPLTASVRHVTERYINVSADDMPAAALHAVECAATHTEIPDTWPMDRIRAHHREILAHDASVGTALYHLFRSSRHAAEVAVTLAASSENIFQIP